MSRTVMKTLSIWICTRSFPPPCLFCFYFPRGMSLLHIEKIIFGLKPIAYTVTRQVSRGRGQWNGGGVHALNLRRWRSVIDNHLLASLLWPAHLRSGMRVRGNVSQQWIGHKTPVLRGMHRTITPKARKTAFLKPFFKHSWGNYYSYACTVPTTP